MQQPLHDALFAYGVTATKWLPSQEGYRNRSHPFIDKQGNLYNIIIYKVEAGIADRVQRANALSNYLHAQGLVSRHTADARILQLRGKQRTAVASLYQYLPGATIPWEAYTKNHIKLLGKTMGVMHGIVAKCPAEVKAALPDALNECDSLLRRMENYFERPGVRQAMAQKLALNSLELSLFSMQTVLEAAAKKTPHQPLHLDFVRGNILFCDSWNGDENLMYLDDHWQPPFISGILDFEKTALGPPVLDVARTLAFLLIDCKYKQPHKVFKYFVLSGYQKRGGVPLDERQLGLLKPLVRFFLIHDFYKFLKHNPYESLPQNEHFIRARDFMLKDGIIKSKI